jgi:dTDP-glucose 4,6-dehydratase
MKAVLVTGGAGFIGSNLVHHLLESHAHLRVMVLDALTYAGNRANLAALEGDPRLEFVQGDVRDAGLVGRLMSEVDAVVHAAAETHVDRSIEDGARFIDTNVAGTEVLLAAARRVPLHRFLVVGTDEVYGSVEEGRCDEECALRPSSPYAASKAAADLLALAHHTTYGTPVVISRSTNNLGPMQYPEKVVPLFITQALEDAPLPLYGDGLNARDWLYVRDHCEALDLLLQRGEPGQVYNVGTEIETPNIVLTREILKRLDKPESLIRPVADRLGHDRRYAVDTSRIRGLGWRPRHMLSHALDETVRWYREHRPWWEDVKRRQEEYRRFLRANYPSLSSS